MSDYTPTTEEVLLNFANNKIISELGCARAEEMLNDGRLMELANEHGEPHLAAARRWLAGHDRDVARTAWEDGYDAGVKDLRDADGWRAVVNPYREVSK